MIITTYTGKTINDIDKQCLTCQNFDNAMIYCKSPFKNHKIRYKGSPKCKRRVGLDEN